MAGEFHDGLSGHSLEEFEGAESAATGVRRHLFEFVFGDFDGLAGDFSVELNFVFHVQGLANFTDHFVEVGDVICV